MKKEKKNLYLFNKTEKLIKTLNFKIMTTLSQFTAQLSNVSFLVVVIMFALIFVCATIAFVQEQRKKDANVVFSFFSLSVACFVLFSIYYAQILTF